MATFTVTTTADTMADDGELSLREAVARADADAAADEIVFAGSVQRGAIELTGGELLVTSDVKIDGGAGGVTLDALAAGRVLRVAGAGADVALQSLTVAGGLVDGSGGGILAESTAASLTVVDSLVAGNGTTGDDDGVGGGVASFAPITLVVNSTVSGNTTAGDEAFGGGIWAANRLVLAEVTVTGNATRGAGSDGAGVAGGGVFVGGRAELGESVVVGNNGAARPTDVGGRAFASDGHNLFGSEVAGDVAGDLENVPAAAVFARTVPVPGGTPVLGGVPADNGGPTGTAALLDSAANPALERGSVGGPDTDQRGEPRPAPGRGAQPDIGAFELQDPPPALVGGARGERLLGTAEDEHLRGLAGDDRLFGRGEGDRLDGGVGDDRLHGGGGGDLLHGGTGADRFVFRRPGHSAPEGQDLVLDFSRRQGDRFDLRGLDGDPAGCGDRRLAFVGRDGFRDAGEVRYHADQGHTVVEVNLDRDGEAELAFRLDRGVDLHRGDFLL